MGAIPADVIVCGDPDRASQISRHLSDATLLSENREYRCFLGTFEGRSVAVCSHGVGAPGAAVAFEELIAAGARRLIRVGTCGGLQRDLDAGDLVVAQAAVDNTGYGAQTVPPGYPAVADPELTLALYEAAARVAGRRLQAGIVLTRDNFYRGVELPSLIDYRIMSVAGVLAVEMECSALFLIGSLRRARAAAILAVDGNLVAAGKEEMDSYQPRQEAVLAAIEVGTQAALSALIHSGDDSG